MFKNYNNKLNINPASLFLTINIPGDAISFYHITNADDQY